MINFPIIGAIACGGALGAVSRYSINHTAEYMFDDKALYGTLLANVIGCFLAGFLLIFWQDSSTSFTLKQGVMVGFLGGLTTFSTFSLETFQLMQNQLWFKASLNMTGNLLLCLLFVFLGAWLGGRMSS